MSSSTSTSFLGLVDDVLSHTLCLCSISSVVAASQTCKRIHGLSFQKHVWQALLQDLNARLLLDRPLRRSLQELSTLELIDSVKRIVQGPRTWSLSDGSLPDIARQYVLHPTILLGPGILHWENEAKLLLGVPYVLFQNWGVLECWSMAEDKLIWTHEAHLGNIRVEQFAAEVVDHGQAAVILICERLYHPSYPRQNYAVIVCLHFATKTSRLLLLTRAPDTAADNPFVNPHICGDIAIVTMNSTNQILVVNWKTEKCLVLLSSTNSSDIALINRYIVMIAQEHSLVLSRITVSSILSLAEHWSPTDLTEPRWKSLAITDLPQLVSDSIEHHPARLVRLRMSAHVSPLCEDSYAIWVQVAPDLMYPTTLNISKFYKYTLSCPSTTTSDPLRLSLRSFASAERGYPIFRDISYAGHIAIFDYERFRNRRVLALLDLDGITEAADATYGHVDLPDTGDDVHISAYSGALTYSTHDSIVVNYYR